MKTIVTHLGPDLDAITSVWLLKTFMPNWEEANVAFVPAGTTLNKETPDHDPNIVHVDTGFGKFDHHQTDEFICAATLVYEEIKKYHGQDPALERLVKKVNEDDHFQQVFYPHPDADYFEFDLSALIGGWRLLHGDDNLKILSLGMDALDAVYKNLQNKVWAEKELIERGKEFETKWGKAMGVETTNDDVIHLGQKKGYSLMIRKDAKKGYVRIKSLPLPTIDLTDVYTTLKTRDPEATWFLHASRHMILNGSTKNPEMRPSSLTLDELIHIVTATSGS
jgi:hypothetical protein